MTLKGTQWPIDGLLAFSMVDQGKGDDFYYAETLDTHLFWMRIRGSWYVVLSSLKFIVL